MTFFWTSPTLSLIIFGVLRHVLTCSSLVPKLSLNPTKNPKCLLNFIPGLLLGDGDDGGCVDLDEDVPPAAVVGVLPVEVLADVDAGALLLVVAAGGDGAPELAAPLDRLRLGRDDGDLETHHKILKSSLHSIWLILVRL